MKITTNNQFRPVLYWNDLNESEQKEYKDVYDTVEESSFFRYRNWTYDLNDFLYAKDLDKWDGYKNETFFSSVLVKLSNCGDSVRVGLATC